MAQKIGAALLSYTETIWKTADTLRGAGIKEGDFPSYMMPFFALMLLESRLRRFKAEKVAEYETAMGVKFDPKNSEHSEWLELSAKAVNKGYHPELLLLDKGLKETCAVPGGNFLNRLMAHLGKYDPETRRLLGLGYAEGTPKFLDIQGKASDLFSRPNSPLSSRCGWVFEGGGAPSVPSLRSRNRERSVVLLPESCGATTNNARSR